MQLPAWRKLHTKITESLDLHDMPDDFTRLFWIMLTLAVDREGRGLDNAAWLKAKTMPLRMDVTIEQVQEAMDWLADHGMIERYSVNGRSYFWIPTWKAYQGDTSREAESNFPEPVTSDAGADRVVAQQPVMTDSGVSQELVTSNSRPTHEQVMTNSRSNADADTDAEEMQRESATAVAPPPKPPPKKRTKRPQPPTPPAIQAFRKAAHRFPAKSWWSDVDAVVGDDPDDLQFWEQCVKAYVGLGWNPTNVKAMLEFYQRREIPNGKARDGPRETALDRSLAAIKRVTGVEVANGT